jgi:2,4-dienoyl-CoA reductase-like NADH-dependent reductase (Old Yellow Enzyme family)
VSVKLNSADFQRGGFSEDESLAVVDMLEAEGVDLLEISGGTYEAAAMVQETGSRESARKREAFFLDYAERVRARSRLPLMLTGGFRSHRAMEAALSAGSIDMVGIGRPLIVEPEFCARVLQNVDAAAAPIALATGHKVFDAFMQTAWYQAQIRRLATGMEPDSTLSRGCATVRYVLPARVDRNPARVQLVPHVA